MIVCVLFSAILLMVIFRWDWIDKKFSKRDLAVGMSALAAFFILLTIWCTARSYTHEGFHVAYAKANVHMTTEKDGVHVKINHQEYVVDPANVVKYEAPDEKSEVVELACVRKTYKPMVPDFLYCLYYMNTPSMETTTEVVSCSVSEYKSK